MHDHLPAARHRRTDTISFKTVNGKEACTTSRTFGGTRERVSVSFKTVNGKEACTTSRTFGGTRERVSVSFKTVNGKEACTTINRKEDWYENSTCEFQNRKR